MKKILTALLVAPMCFAISFQALAAGSTGPVNLTSVSAGALGDVFIRTDGGAVTSEGCTNSTRLLLPRDHAAKNALLAILLTANASEAEVVVSVNGCTAVGAQTYNEIFNVEVN